MFDEQTDGSLWALKLQLHIKGVLIFTNWCFTWLTLSIRLDFTCNLIGRACNCLKWRS